MREAYQFSMEMARRFGIFTDRRDQAASVAMTTLAKYGGYRRFEVTTDETYQPPDKK
jgi:hypothetical protein